MVRRIEAIFSQGAFRPVQPVSLPQGARVQLSVEEQTTSAAASPAAKMLSPELAHPEGAADFRMEVWETGDAGV